VSSGSMNSSSLCATNQKQCQRRVQNQRVALAREVVLEDGDAPCLFQQQPPLKANESCSISAWSVGRRFLSLLRGALRRNISYLQFPKRHLDRLLLVSTVDLQADGITGFLAQQNSAQS